MPAVVAPAKVLVTGANGFVALWVVHNLLQRGYVVRGTVRSSKKGEALKKLLVTKVGENAEKFEYVVVENISEDGAFDEAVVDVDAIMHTASPVTFDVQDPQELIVPAVGGTTGLLKSALKNGEGVKRIVITSSTGAILSPDPTSRAFDENDWNDASVKVVEEKGKDAPKIMMYWASKVLAERAAWKFHKDHEHVVGWDITVIHPSFVFGPVLSDVPSPSALNVSMLDWYNGVFQKSTHDQYQAASHNYIDVRDVAEMHTRTLERVEAGGHRIIASSRVSTWQDWLGAANAIVPHIPGLPRGSPGSGASVSHSRTYSNSKAMRVLGMQFKPLEETCKDILDDFRQRGWLDA